ncbi:hypothetical protein Btru_050981, partial [Bulinus truncatus]
MDKVTSSFVQVWHTSSTHLADDSNGVIEGIVRASGDLKITVDFPVVRETQIVTSGMHQQDDQTKVTDSQIIILQLHLSKRETFILDQPKNEKKEQNYDSAVDKILLACDHFSELTTFHGMRLVCSRGPNHIRRLIWTVMILACMVALALQVRQQVLYFLSNPKSINVEKKFVDSLDFPTVTICNENSFRISAAYEHGLYDVINELFNGTLTESEVNRTGVTNLRLDEFNYKAGNRIENMILRCKWNTLENCYSNNFTRIITDHGLCYSFNGPDSIRELTVQTPGATKNLQLTLNIEEYERMSGAQVASGIHILVHNRREFPLVKQLGQAVAAGSHTYIALTLKKELPTFSLDEFNYKAGNRIENMILRCKWNTLENCYSNNFTRIITDHGLCYSFNGPDSIRELTVQTPGATKNLQLTLNIEEYERMSGAQVASGIHILVHNRREFPLVKQLGQAVAAGSHTYIALTLKKESRLGYPYDTCQDGILIHVPNKTYSYSLPACQTECYVTFVVSRCGCRDYFMPGNKSQTNQFSPITDSPVCTFKQYVQCLKQAQKEYDADKVCDCSAPCDLDLVESTYSYGSLSKLAGIKVKDADLDKMKIRLRRALDVHDFINSDAAPKKDMYHNFTLVLNIVKQFYISQMTTLQIQFRKSFQIDDFLSRSHSDKAKCGASNQVLGKGPSVGQKTKCGARDQVWGKGPSVEQGTKCGARGQVWGKEPSVGQGAKLGQGAKCRTRSQVDQVWGKGPSVEQGTKCGARGQVWGKEPSWGKGPSVGQGAKCGSRDQVRGTGPVWGKGPSVRQVGKCGASDQVCGKGPSVGQGANCGARDHKLMELNKKANQMYTIRQDLLWSQIYIIKKYFIEPKRTLDKITIGKEKEKLNSIGEDIELWQQWLVQLTNLSLSSLEDLKAAYSSGSPLYNGSLVTSNRQTDYESMMLWRIVPKKLLQTALNRSTDVTLRETVVTSAVNEIMDTLIKLKDILKENYETRRPALDSVKEILEKFKALCESYFLSNQILYDETIEWPLAELITQRVDLQSSKHICDKYFRATDDTSINVMDVCSETAMTSLNFFSNFSNLVQSYLGSFNSSKFDLADLLLGKESEIAKDRLRATGHLLISYFLDLSTGLNRISSCLKENLKEIMEDDDSLKAAYEERGQKVGVSLSSLSQLVSVDIVQLENILSEMKRIEKENERLLK